MIGSRNKTPQQVSGLSDYIAWTIVCAYALLIALMMRPGPHVVFGNLHDLFIPINSAYAVDSGFRLHTDFHSPFGLYYHATNHFSFEIVRRWPDRFDLLDMIMLTSVFTAVIFTALFFVIRKTQIQGMKMTSWGFVALFTLIFQVRDASTIWDHRPLWYAIYNHQAWALLLLQIIHAFVYVVNKNHSGRDTVLFGGLQAVFLLLALHFKISFFAASGLVCLAAMFLLPQRHLIAYVASGLAVVLFGMLALTIAGYDYLGFVADNLAAIDARSSGLADSISLRPAVLASFLFVAAVQLLRFGSQISITPQTSLVRVIIAIWKEGIWPRVTARQLIFDGLIALAVLAAAAGDFRRPWIYFALVLWLLPGWKTTPVFRRALLPLCLVAFAVLFNFRNLAATTLLVGGKFWQPEYSARNDFSSISKVTIRGASEEIELIIGNGTSIDDFTAEGLFERAPDWTAKMIRHAYTLIPDRKVAKWLPWGNTQYVSDVNHVMDYLLQLELDQSPDTVVEALTFTNPYPFLLRSELPKGSHHWLHFGTTFAPKNVDSLLNRLESADVVVVPVRDELAAEDRVYLSCRFLRWNGQRKEPFVLTALRGRILVFTSHQFSKENDLRPLAAVDILEADRVCSKTPFDSALIAQQDTVAVD